MMTEKTSLPEIHNSRLQFFLKNSVTFHVLVLVAVTVVSRLPQLLSPKLLLDGDECIQALQAKHIAEGNISYFFYGQSYGFTFVENVVSAGFGLFLSGAPAVKLSMLSIWICGLLFFYFTLKKMLNSHWLPLILSLLLILNPAWAVWSMKARGGYLTAFALSSIVVYLCTYPGGVIGYPRTVLLAFLLVIIYYAQALWLPALVPVLFFKWYFSVNRLRSFATFATAALLTNLLFFVLRSDTSNFWQPKVFELPENILPVIKQIPESVFTHLTGSYDYFYRIGLGDCVDNLSWFFTILTFVVLAAGLLYTIFRFRKNLNDPVITFTIGIFGTVSYLLLLNGFQPRYLLPLSALVFILTGLFADRLPGRKLIRLLLVLLMIPCALALYSFKDYAIESQTGPSIKELCTRLQKENLRYAYCTGPLLQWQITWYSDEHTICRYKFPHDRYPDYIHKVDSAFRAGSASVCLVGFIDDSIRQNPDSCILVSDTYFIRKSPSATTLANHGFQIAEPK